MGIRAPRPARERSAAGPFIFVLLIVGLLVGGFVFGRPIAEDAIVAQVQEHDTLLKQSIIRGLIADRVGSEPDLAKDPNAESRTFVITSSPARATAITGWLFMKVATSGKNGRSAMWA